MSKVKSIIELIKAQGVIPLFYHDHPKVCYEVVRALYEGGVRIVEFTNRGEKAIDNFKYLLKKRDQLWPDLLIAVGTIKREQDAKVFVNAGADFIISPGVVGRIARVLRKEGVFWIPGCMSVTEIMLAESYGARIVKLFPGTLLGPGFVNAVKELFPGILFMPTGGVEIEVENLESWFKAGVCAVGIGSKLVTKDILADKQFDRITEQTKEILMIINRVRNN